MYSRRIQIGKQTYLCCNIKTAMCEGENGSVQYNEKHWQAIQKLLHPLLLQCLTDLKNKDITVEFYGSVPCTIDDLYLKISYELKPRNNCNFFMVQPRSDDDMWENALSNISDDRNVYSNFGGFFENVCFLNYILQINISKREELSKSSLSGCDNERNNEEKSSYFQENMSCESNPLEAVLKSKKHNSKKNKAAIKHHKKIKEIGNDATSVECINALITSHVSKDDVIPAADVIMPCHTLPTDGDKSRKKVKKEIAKTNFKHSPVFPKKRSSFPPGIASKEGISHVPSNLSRAFNKEVPLDTLSKETQPNQANASNEKRINSLLEANPTIDNAVITNKLINGPSLSNNQNKFCCYENLTETIFHDDTEIQLPSLAEVTRQNALCTQNSPSSIVRKETISNSSSKDLVLPKSPSSNKTKNINKNGKLKLTKIKDSNMKFSTQTSVVKNSNENTNVLLKTTSPKGKTRSARQCTENNKEKTDKELKKNTFKFKHNITLLREFSPKNQLEYKNGTYKEENTDISLNESITYRDFKTLKQLNINNETSDKLNSKRKLSPVSSQRTKRKPFKIDSTNKYLNNGSFEKDDTTCKISRLRQLFLESKKKINVKEFSDIAVLQTNVSPIYHNSQQIDKSTLGLNGDIKRMQQTPLVSNLTKPQLHHIFKENLVKLKDISCRKAYCRRHEDFIRGGKANYELTYQVNLSPFREEQLDYVMELLMSEFYVKPDEDIDYLLKVLLPEALIIIFMEFHGTDYENSDRLMAEAAFNAENVEVL